MDKTNKYQKEENVKIMGSDSLTWKIIDIKSNEEYDFIYILKLIEGESIIDELPWVPECLLFKK